MDMYQSWLPHQNAVASSSSALPPAPAPNEVWAAAADAPAPAPAPAPSEYPDVAHGECRAYIPSKSAP
jgi:hypothetical protein